MQRALAVHDHLGRACVEKHGGQVVKMTGDGMCAVFADPLARGRGDARLPAGAGADPGRRRPRAARALRHPRRERRSAAMTTTSAARSIARRGSWARRTAGRCCCRRRSSISCVDDCPTRSRCATWAWSSCATSRAPSASTSCSTRRCAATSRRCARSRPRRTTCRSRRRRSSAASASSRTRGRRCDRTRMLTLVGAGGIGKTRLSLQLAAEVLDDYADGVVVRRARAARRRSALVRQAVATVLGVKEEAGRAASRLAGRVTSRTSDCCWCSTTASTCSAPARRSRRASCAVRAGLRILASSREPLRIAGEATYPVPRAGRPGSGGARRRRPTFASYPAVRLFVERASAVLPSFPLDDGNGRTVGERSAGTSTAFRWRSSSRRHARALMPVATIAARLDDRFRLLTSGSRDRAAAPADAARADRLEPRPARRARAHAVPPARRCSPAAGRSRPRRRCAQAAHIAREDVLELLAGLVDKSLVAADLA